MYSVLSLAHPGPVSSVSVWANTVLCKTDGCSLTYGGALCDTDSSSE